MQKYHKSGASNYTIFQVFWIQTNLCDEQNYILKILIVFIALIVFFYFNLIFITQRYGFRNLGGKLQMGHFFIILS